MMNLKSASLGITIWCVAVLAPLGCSSVVKTTTPAADGGPSALSVDYTGTMTCVDDRGPTSMAPLRLNEVESCIAFNGQAAFPNRLSLQFRRAGEAAKDSLNAKINSAGGFTKVGDYVTDVGAGPDTSTYVDIKAYNDTPDATGSHDSPGGTSGGDAACHGACTIHITNADVLNAASGGTGRLTGSITCSSQTAAGLGCIRCTYAAPTINFDIKDCSRSD